LTGDSRQDSYEDSASIVSYLRYSVTLLHKRYTGHMMTLFSVLCQLISLRYPPESVKFQLNCLMQ